MSRQIFANLCEDEASGVRPLVQRELEAERKEPLGWEDDFPWIRMLSAHELPRGYASGWRIEGFLIDPRRYLPWLERRMQILGGRMEIRRLSRLEDVEADLLINCSGIGAKVLCGDEQMQPVRGQVAVVRIGGITEGISDEHDPNRISYVYPRTDEIILGGTREVGNDLLPPDPATTERILADCRMLVPALAGARFVESRVGVRPGRHEVRLEVETLNDRRHVVHNYGHGGQGFILSWGCASDVVNEVARLAGRPKSQSGNGIE
jgi:D-amino-acid oxidase